MKKRWGQNFLGYHNIAGKIIKETGIEPGDAVIEIGPGRGILTGSIADKAGRVIAVEIDRGLSEELRQKLESHKNLEIINSDFLEVDLADLLKRVSTRALPVKIISNLPYNITTPVIMKILSIPSELKPIECVFMVQKEVADRIKASPGGKDYGMLSVAVQYHCDVEWIFKVSRNVFHPKPEVDSAVIRLYVRKEPGVSVKDEKLFFKIARAAFSQRRKKFYNPVSNMLEVEKSILWEVMDKAGIDRARRPETLSISQFARISDLLYEKIS